MLFFAILVLSRFTPLSTIETIGLSGLIVAIIADYRTNRTTWLCIVPRYIMVLTGYLFAILGWLIFCEHLTLPSFATPFLLLISASSDVIANASRKKHLIVAGGLTLATETILFAIHPHRDPVMIYPFIAFAAAGVRFGFPPATQTLHTSLDYGKVRLEVLSLGMREYIAIGIHNNRIQGHGKSGF